MRYFFLIFGLCVVITMSIAGKRGTASRKPPLQVFPDMDRQAKLRPQTPDNAFPDGRSSRLPVPGTIERSSPFTNVLTAQGVAQVYSFEDSPMNTGRVPGATNFVESMPLRATAQMLARGRERYQIYCTPCHSPTGDGNGMVKKFGYATVRNLHEPAIVQQTDGEVFNTITHGKLTMWGYGAQIDIEDRWAIVAYVRALQLSRLASIEDVPEPLRASLKK